MGKQVVLIKGKKPAVTKKNPTKFSIDCKAPIEDKVFYPEDFTSFLKSKIKVGGKVNNLSEQVTIGSDKTNINVQASIPLAKRYLKYLTKKYLRKQELRDYLHVVSTGKSTYELRYFNIQNEGEE